MTNQPCDCDDIVTCACHVSNTDCVHISGGGSTGRPLLATFNLSTAATNILECGPAGLGAFLPSYLTNPPAAHASLAFAQPVANSVTTILILSRERYDTDSMHSESQNQSRFVINTAGVYLVSGWGVWSGNADGERRMNVKLNTKSNIAQDERVSLYADPLTHPFQAYWKFDAGDYFEIEVHQNSGVDLEMTRLNVSATYLGTGE